MTEKVNENAYEPIFVARQPIFDKRLKIWGYELLFRHSGELNYAEFRDPTVATSQVIVDGLNLAEEGIPHGKKLFINFPKELILEGTPHALPQGHVVELLEDVSPDEDILEQCDLLKKKYLLAMDDYTGQPGYEELLERAHIIKVDVLSMDPDRLACLAKKLTPLNRVLLAEKVETKEVFDQARELGFFLFQGFFFSKPVVSAGRKLTTSQISRLRILRELKGKEYDPRALSRVVEADVSLSYRLLRYINSPFFGLASKITSIFHAVNLLGELQIRQWLRILLLADLNPSDRGQEMVRLCAARGRFLLSMAQKYGLPWPPDTMFLIGLFSALDTILDQPMEQVLNELPLTPELSRTLLGEKTSLAPWLELVKALQQAEWKRVLKLTRDLGVDLVAAAHVFNEASRWSLSLLREARSETR